MSTPSYTFLFNISDMNKLLSERIKIVQNITGWNNAELARQSGVTRAAITDWLNGKVKTMTAEVANTLSRNTGFSAMWLAAGKGEMTVVDNNISQPIEQESSVFDVLDVRAACGAGALNPDYPTIINKLVMPIEVAKELIGNINKNGNVKVIMAAKDSMIPTINPNDLLFVDTLVTEYRGEGVYILLHGGELLCKRLSAVAKDILVQSDNKNYATWSWNERPDDTRIIGKVIRALPLEFKNFGN